MKQITNKLSECSRKALKHVATYKYTAYDLNVSSSNPISNDSGDSAKIWDE